MPNTYSALYTHAVFSTKHRQPLITKDLRPRLTEYIGGICRNAKCSLVDAGGVEDHMHLLVRRHTTVCEAELMEVVKANSSKWFKHLVPGFSWQDGGGVFSVGPQDLDSVRAYFAIQEEHHRQMDFLQELEVFLKKYQVEYDPRYFGD